MKHYHARTSRFVKRVAVTAALVPFLAAVEGVKPSQARTHRHHARTAHAEHTEHGSRSYDGIASVYSGGRTASGERMNAGAMTAAHRTLPFGTLVTVVNHSNGRVAMVRINDRGPFVRGRVIDLSPAAARALGVSGLAPVSLNVGGRSL